MNCRHCGTELPPRAMFCGECGRAVAAPAASPVRSSGIPFDTTTLSPPRSSERVDAAPPPPAVPIHPVQPEIFFDRRAQPVMEQPTEAPEPAPAPEPEPVPEPAPEPDDPRFDDLPPIAPTGAEAPPTVAPVSWSPPPAPAPSEVPPTVLPVPDFGPADPAPAEPIQDLEQTRLVLPTGDGVRFVLQFSTGESVTVRGTGLIGRNPSAEPGEYVDQLVTLFDAGKSVSKTHLEFGQESGVFWISDRFSTNGSAVRPPGEAPRRADPGKRYRISRGTRVDIGEQFFVVS